MPRMVVQDQHRENRQGQKSAQIMSAAKTLFTSQGFGATSMDAIVRMANVSKATLYAHFSGKEELFAAIVSHECRTQQSLLWAPGVEEKEVEDALGEIGRNFLGLILSAPAVAIFRVVVAESARFPDLGRIFFNSGPNQMRQSLSSYLAKATARGRLDIDDPWRAAEHFIGMLQTPVHFSVLFGVKDHFSRDELDGIVKDAVGAFLRAYLPRDRMEKS
ncbi:TetR/AcrR family transcriptional regulator [Skermanella mucosa]|uniref:TetR/AcrR family transcriptional regulator n=1 Tax=Skermanella mucosa TaxID=1789672 RepID=UPI00192AF8AD|nr:TetR/AcrR family transcriptional regulator [Skermanella mucosa]UEM23274.1 TetR/AcrR family transcriptional regulator [Skermanella mucosa]